MSACKTAPKFYYPSIFYSLFCALKDWTMINLSVDEWQSYLISSKIQKKKRKTKFSRWIRLDYCICFLLCKCCSWWCNFYNWRSTCNWMAEWFSFKCYASIHCSVFNERLLSDLRSNYFLLCNIPNYSKLPEHWFSILFFCKSGLIRQIELVINCLAKKLMFDIHILRFYAAKTFGFWAELIKLGSFIGPVASFLTDKYGCRLVTIGGAIVTSIGLISASFSPTLLLLYLTYGIIGG